MKKQHNTVDEQFKTCTKCEAELPIEEFYNNQKSWCRSCDNGDAKERMKRFNGTFRGKAYQARNTARKSRKKEERLKGIEIKDDLSIHHVLFTLSAGFCEYCGKELDLMESQLDHIVSMKHGGTNTFDNVACSCKECNRSKWDRPVYDFLMSIGKLEEMQSLGERVASRKRAYYHQVIEEWSDQATEFHLNDMKERVDRANKKEVSK